MSFSFLGSLASLLPNYIQGQRMAVNDNWNDLMKYNQVQQGQQANTFTEATWQPRVDMVWNEGVNSSLGTGANAMRYRVMQAGFPGEYMNSLLGSVYGPQAELMKYLNAFQMQNQLGNAQLGWGQMPLFPQQQQWGGAFAPVPQNIR